VELVRGTAVQYVVQGHYALTQPTSQVPAVQLVMIIYANLLAVLVVRPMIPGNLTSVQHVGVVVMENLFHV